MFTPNKVLLWMQFSWVVWLTFCVNSTRVLSNFYSILSNFTRNSELVLLTITALVYSPLRVSVDARFTQYFVLFLLGFFCSVLYLTIPPRYKIPVNLLNPVGTVRMKSRLRQWEWHGKNTSRSNPDKESVDKESVHEDCDLKDWH